MSGGKKETSPFISASVIAFILAGAAAVIYQPALESTRPGAADLKGLEARGEERVQARLWQDPFMAVTDHKNGEKNDGSKLTVDLQPGVFVRLEAQNDRAGGHHQIKKLDLSSGDAGKVKVMMVMTKGGPYAEDHEARLRDRNAVLSALGVACFVPNDPEHIGYFKWPPASAPKTNPNGNSQDVAKHLKFVPYEWFDHRKLRKCGEPIDSIGRVFVLWFQEEDLGEQPLTALNEVWKQIVSANKKAKPSLVILGPRSSSGLRAMVEDVLGKSGSPNATLFADIHDGLNLWSPWATVDDELLVYGLSEENEKDKKECVPHETGESEEWASKCVKEIFKRKNVNLFRTIPSDHKLVEALLKELRNRGKIKDLPDLNSKDDAHKKGKIAIVSEWDTFYGRSFPLEFRRTICSQAKQNEKGPKCNGSMNALGHFVEHPEDDEKSGVFRYSYLRGLDGKVPGRDQAQTGNKGKDKEAPTAKEAIRSIGLGEMERPVGESQLDYTRRLANVIRERDEEQKAKCGRWKRFIHECGGIEAIGVTGSDVYDKLLILQALRQRLPDKVFFTTDLDDRYVDPEQIKWTRSLIVASHFGLRLERQIQRDIPPFRDSYQTSAFYGVLRALMLLHFHCGQELKAPCDPSVLESSLERYPGNDPENPVLPYNPEVPVRLYEIGNKEPVAIGLYWGQIDPARENTLLHEYLKPPFGWADLALFFSYLVVGGTLAIGLLCLTTTLYSRVKKWIEKDFNFKEGALVLGVPIGVVTLVCWILLKQGASGEPVVALTHGISIWPTEIIRLSVVLMTCYVLWFARNRVKHPFKYPNDKILETNDEILKAMVTRLSGTPTGTPSESKRVNPRKIWKDYLDEGKLGVRVWSIAALFFIFGMMLLWEIDGEFPGSPCRGYFACSADRFIVLLSSICLLTLIAFVFHVTRVSRRMIEQLNKGDTDWWPGAQDTKVPNYRLKAESDWWDVRFVAGHTASIASLVYFPFIAVFLMIFARNPIFDAWHYSPGLVILFALSSSMCLISAFLLRRVAEKSRQRALGNLRGYLEAVIGRDENLEKFIRYRIEEVESIKDGAYASFLARPEIRALGLLAATFLHIYLTP